MFRRIDRYILRSMAVPAALGLVLYLAVLLVNSFFKLAELAVQDRVPLADIGRMVLYLLPNLLTMTIPMAVLLGVLVGLSTLASRSELLAMKACGLSPARMLGPVLFVGLMGAAGSMWMYHRFVPDWNQAYIDLRIRIARSMDVTRAITPRVFHENQPGMVLYADDVSADGKSLKRLVLHLDAKPPERPTHEFFVARTGRIRHEDDGGMRIELENGTQHRYIDPAKYEKLDFEKYVLQYEPRETDRNSGEDTRRSSRGPRQMTVGQLLDALNRQYEGKGKQIVWSRRQRNYRAELHKRFALPLAAVVFALLAFPLGSTIRRGGRASGFAISIGVILTYWVMIKWGEDFAIQARGPVWVGIWFPNLFFLALALLLTLYGGEGSILSRIQPLQRSVDLLRKLASRFARPLSRFLDARPLAQARGGTRRVGTGLSKLDAYVLSTYLKSLLFLFCSLYLVYVVGDYFLTRAKHVTKNDIAFDMVLDYYRFMTPQIVQFILPLAAMVAALVAFGMLASSNEVRAMVCSGVSIYRIVVPVILVAGALSVLSYWIHDYVLPYSTRRAEELDDIMEGRSPRSHYRPGRRWVFGENGRLYHYTRFDESLGRFLRLEVLELSPAFQIRRRLYATQATWDGEAWLAQGNSWVRTFRDGESTFETFMERRFEWPESPAYFSAETKPPDEMRFAEYALYIEELAQSGYETRGMRAELWHKAAFPSVTFILVFLGLPFAFRSEGKGSLYGVGLALALAMIYYAMMAVFTALGRAELLPPILAAFAPNVLFLGAALYLLLNVRT